MSIYREDHYSGRMQKKAQNTPINRWTVFFLKAKANLLIVDSIQRDVRIGL